jgi:hypothetical protein
MLRSVLIAAVVLAAGPALAQSVTLKGPDGQMEMSAAQVAALPRVKVAVDAHGQKHTYEGPQLIDVVAKVGAPTGKDLRGVGMSNAIIVKGADGYQVAFGLSEADPNTRPNKMILADRVDGKPIGSKDGPFKLVVEGDLRPARSAKMVSVIEVINLGGGVVPADQEHH